MGSTPPKQYVILSLPNSGSDWLADVICQSSGLRYFRKEFFNPICNARHGDRLADGFGCELVGCYKNIAAPYDVDELDRIYSETWEGSGYDFNKEVFSPFRVGWFARHFQIVVLVRSIEGVFPPARLRVWQWYEAIWQSIAYSFQPLPLDTMVARALAGYQTAHTAMVRDAAELGIHVLRYDDLIQLPEADLRKHLGQGWLAEVIDQDRAVARILETRDPRGCQKPDLAGVIGGGRLTHSRSPPPGSDLR